MADHQNDLTPVPMVKPGALAIQNDAAAAVRDFLTAIERRDVEAASTFLHDDVAFKLVPFPELRGKADVVRQLRGLLAAIASMHIEMHNIAANGDTVLTERTHTLELGPVPVQLWMCGTFETRNGKITMWRDRFDVAEFTFSAIRGIAHAASQMQIEQRRR
ncbi:nuclear transport factor 2 family protein [Hoyosella rhizosphaerae]|uniref:Epoxide hydrolase EphG n=1 Tax=Hoyosella rhizosphaerae TaxID=1755582 RepID=A0A916XG65_9ACTN|nr:limonene-1,2-epoxide hydrolase family protein [Hoyosella rhizosphaerae]MBN4925584.1 nuclear transport factor 2 family protein [Hoyosella rhizosphaerae]GGC69509.1 epoxide hydrolase EphG [Hoyosella rhizosphaerae]